jgi:hypothetical protein
MFCVLYRVLSKLLSFLPPPFHLPPPHHIHHPLTAPIYGWLLTSWLLLAWESLSGSKTESYVMCVLLGIWINFPHLIIIFVEVAVPIALNKKNLIIVLCDLLSFACLTAHVFYLLVFLSCRQTPPLKGSVKWKKRGGVSGINRWAIYSSTFPQIFYCFLKDPGPLNNKKHISAA